MAASWMMCPFSDKGCELSRNHVVGVLGTEVPRHACMQPTAWLSSRPYGPSSSTRHPRPSRGSKPREADDARPPLEWPSQVGSRGAEISRWGKPHEALVTCAMMNGTRRVLGERRCAQRP